MEFRDKETWDKGLEKNKDPYGGAVYAYAEAWADLMEKKMAEGQKLEDIADKSGHEADTDGITGFMYGCAVQVLSGVWKHGEALRRWHNTATQINDEGDKANESGGVSNPAILRIGK